METQRSKRIPLPRRPKYLFDYYVSGTGDFPFDMLRHDTAWPASTEDARALNQNGRRSIHLHSYEEPEPDRWSSFLWSVGTQKIH